MIETLKLYQMYLKREKDNYKTDLSKTAVENLAEYVSISLTLDRITDAIDYLSEE